VAAIILGTSATPDALQTLRHQLGLDQPGWMRYLQWVGGMLQGDFGTSVLSHSAVGPLIVQKLAVSGPLALASAAIALALAVPLGVVTAVRRDGAVDHAGTVVTVLGQAVPSFWLALILMIVLGLQLGILPISGTGTWQHFVMPGIVLAFTAIPALTRLTRSGMIESMASDYIRTARAKGLSRARIIFKHALRNAAIPVVSIAAVQLGFMLGGSIVIETVFALHGVGYLGWESIAKNDFPVVQAVVLVLAVFYIGLTLLADILNALLDPRLRTG
jgi:peptide/nickel transport system permease protein